MAEREDTDLSSLPDLQRVFRRRIQISMNDSYGKQRIVSDAVTTRQFGIRNGEFGQSPIDHIRNQSQQARRLPLLLMDV